MDISWQRKIISFCISLPFRIFKRNCKEIVDPKKILIIHWTYLGDIITASPSFQQLKIAFPNAEITLLTSPGNKQYIASNPFIDKFIFINNPLHLRKTSFLKNSILKTIIDIRKTKYDFAIELSGRLTNQVFVPFIKARLKVGEDTTNNSYYFDKRICNNQVNEVDRNRRVIELVTGINKQTYDLWNPTTTEDSIFVHEYLQDKKISYPFIIAHITASWIPRQWDLKKWKSVIDYIISKNRSVVIIGSPDEKEKINSFLNFIDTSNVFNSAGDLTLSQLIALMSNAEVFIGNDSGPMHLAAAAKLKGVVLFGPAAPFKWSHSIHRIVYKKQSCSPCPQFACNSKCAKGYSECKALVAIEPNDIIIELDKLFQEFYIQ